MRIDAHQHFWQLSRGDYDWLTPELTILYRDFLPEDLQPLLHDARIDKTILVQAAESVAESQFMLSLAAQTPFIAGVVGWIDFESPQAVADIERLASNPRLVGLRPMLQNMHDARWILRPELEPALRAAQTHDVCFDALVRPRHLPAIVELAERHPALPIVIDHAAKPSIRDGWIEEWRAQMQRLGRIGHVHCKLSGLVTEAGVDWNVDRLRPYVDTLLECFGPARLMWGSDWPVVLDAADYSRWLDTAESLVSELSSDEQARIFGATAAAFYGIAAD